jgi:release factor glutamine methyltransferase
MSGADEAWTVRRVLTWATEDLRARGSSSPRLDAELLLGMVLSADRIRLILDAERPLSKDELSAYKALHQRRRAGEPVAYLRGTREFYGRPFVVDKRVLVPRPETELLVEVALDRTRSLSLSARTLDLCTGSGCVAVTLGRERPTTRVLGVDVSAAALAVARENAIRLGAINTAFLEGDLFAGLEGKLFDLVTANPPYIADAEIPELPADVRDFEPRLALAGGHDGLDLVRRIIATAPRHTTTGSVVALEIGAGQAPDVARLFEQAGYADVSIARDLAGHERVVSAKRP